MEESGSCQQSEAHCSLESNNNITDIIKLILSQFFNNCSQNGLHSLDLSAKETDENTVINKAETISFQKHVQSRKNRNLPIESGTTNELNIDNNCIDTDHSTLVVNEDTTKTFLSIAMKLSENEERYNCSDDFENENISNESIGAAFQTSSSLEIQNEVNSDTYIEEDNQINNSLKLLQSLVNIEHDKLEVQKCSTTEEEHLLPNSSANEKKQGKVSDTTNEKKYKSHKSMDKVHQVSVKEDASKNMKRKKQESEENENKSKKVKHEYKVSKKSKKVSRLQNDMNNLSTDFGKNVKTDTKDIQIPDTSVKSPIASQSTKDNESSKELQVQKYTTENSKLNEEKNTVSVDDSNALLMKTNPAPTTNCSDKNVENVKTKSSNHSRSTKIPSDLKKMYDKYCQNLFSPDIIFKSNLPKDSLTNQCLKNENNVICKEKKDNNELDKKSKPRGQFKIPLTILSDKKKMSKDSSKLKKKIVPKASTKTLSNSSKDKNDNKKYKRLKVEQDDCETVAIMNKNEESITKLPETINTVEILETNRINTLPNTNILEKNSMPDWLKAKCEECKIKPCYVRLEIIDTNFPPKA